MIFRDPNKNYVVTATVVYTLMLTMAIVMALYCTLTVIYFMP